MTEDQLNCEGGWWCIHEDDIMGMLRRAAAGEDPDLIYAEYYVNSEHEDFKGE